ncbi:hypothetical protein D9M71_412490 [compost metagenome]
MLDLSYRAVQSPAYRGIDLALLAEADGGAFDEVARGRQRLAQFVGDGDGHFAHGVVARQVFQFAFALPAGFLGAYLFGHVAEQQQMADQVVLDLDVAAGRVVPAPFAVASLQVVMHAVRHAVRQLHGQAAGQPVA